MRALVPCLLLLLVHCGGPSSAAHSAADRDADSDAPGEAASSDGEADGDEAAEAPSGPSCDDGTCSLCGAGICPTGWYCDENATGGAACSWLTECADKPSCGCITRVLGSECKCREEGGGLKVSCG